MKHIITIILLLLPLLATPQSTESTQLYTKSIELSNAGDYEQAIALLKKSDSLDKIQLDPSHKNYHRAEYGIAVCENNFATSLIVARNIDESIRHQKVALDIFKRILGEDSNEYYSSLNELAFFYNEKGDFAEAIRIETTAAEICKNSLGEEAPKYAYMLYNLSHFYRDYGNNSEWYRLVTEAMGIYEKTLGKESTEYADALEDIAIYNLSIDDITEAIRLETIVTEIHKKTSGDVSSEYANALNNLANIYGYVGNTKEAARLATIAMNIYKALWGEDRTKYASSLRTLATINKELGDIEESIRLEKEAAEIDKNYYGEDNPRYASTLDRLAGKYSDLRGNYTEAIRLETIVTEIYKKAYGEQNSLYAQSLADLAFYYSKNGQHAEAIRLADIAYDINNNDPNAIPQTQTVVNKTIADIHLEAGNYDKATTIYQQVYNYKTNYILKNFATMTSQERSDIWRGEDNFFSKNLPYATYKISTTDPSHYSGTTKEDITSLSFNSLLLSKGLLLNAELEIHKLIEQSDNKEFAKRYYQLKQNRVLLDNIYQTPADKRTTDPEKLQKLIDDEERAFVQSSKALGDYTQNLSISWQDVQRNLNGKDVAIEFVNVQDTARHWIYSAFVLKKGMATPEFVTLFDSDSLAMFEYIDSWEIEPKEVYNTSKLYDMVWTPLAKYLEGAKNVYFAPAGQIHSIGIEYLTDAEGNLFAEKYNTYRLSSTRELAKTHHVNSSKKATTYGGIQYEFSADDWQKQRNADAPEQKSYRDIPLLSDNLRSGGMEYLEGTKKESESIATLLRKAKYDVRAISDEEATEESFKKLSGSGIKILHIGTHGFYKSDGDMENAGYNFYTASVNQSTEDRSMSCSGLLFAGANSALSPRRNAEIPEGADDGILTAKEISRLDFQGLDMVILSACQTGLGAITGEGVFGLQRGFKKAGAQTILMSLWSVADESTELLMTEFFKNLTAGQSKRAAFLTAVQTVREKYPNPLYWAAFVMVDAI